MRNFVNGTAKNIRPSGIRKFFDIVRETEGAISLGVGEPDFITPWRVRQAAINAVERGYTQYTGNRGLPTLLDLIARYLSDRFSLDYEPNRILLTVGASEGVDLVLRACVEIGEEVLIPEPAYVSYAPLVSLAGGKPILLPCKEENGFVLQAETIERATTKKTKAVILNYPNNPTGAVLEETDLESLARVIEKHDLLVITDEVYAELTYAKKHASIARIKGMQARTAYIGGFSKAFAMTGWRLGFVCAPPEIDEAIFKIHQYGIMCAPTLSQYAAIEALQNGFTDGFATVEEMRESYDTRRKFVLRSLSEIGLPCFTPRGAFYAFPSVETTGLSDESFAERLLKEKKVAVVPGNAFGAFGADHARISYATGKDSLIEAFDRIRAFLGSLR